MTEGQDPYWDDLGVVWTAANPDVDVIKPRLQARLRRQSLLIAAGLAIGIPLSIAGLALATWTIWVAWTAGALNFYVRGIAIAVISLLLGRAVSLLLPVRAGDAARSLMAMLDLAIGRAQRTGTVIRLGLYSCLAAAALGLVGTAIRMQSGHPPQMSPIVDLVILAGVASGLFFYGRYNSISLEKLRALQRALLSGEDR